MTIFCSHDAGGSNQILYMYLDYGIKDVDEVLVTGPGLKIAEDLGIATLNGFDYELFDRHNLFIVGSSAPQPIKVHDFLIREAKRRQKWVIGVLDNWENFEKRWPMGLPDEIWTTDRYAFEIAKKVFVGKPIKLVANSYIQNYKKKLDGIKRSDESVLFINSPYKRIGSQTFNHNNLCICEILDHLTRTYQKKAIVLRNHPNQNTRFCNEHKRDYGNEKQIHLSTQAFLYQDLAITSLVIGFPSYALFVAKELGFTTLSLGEFDQPGAPLFPKVNFPAGLG